MIPFTPGFLGLVIVDVNSNLTPSSAALAFLAGEALVVLSPQFAAFTATYNPELLTSAGGTLVGHYLMGLTQAGSIGLGIVAALALYVSKAAQTPPSRPGANLSGNLGRTDMTDRPIFPGQGYLGSLRL